MWSNINNSIEQINRKKGKKILNKLSHVPSKTNLDVYID